MNVFASSEQIDKLFPPATSNDISIAQSDLEVSNSGKAGHSIRMKERTPLVELTDVEAEKYFSNIHGADLYHSPDSVPTMSAENLFNNSQSITWDLGAGRGERIINLAAQYPDRNFVGVDIHYRSALLGARAAADAQLDNVHFIRADSRLLMQKIPTDTADEVGILFPAPQPNRNGGFDDVLQAPLVGEVARILDQAGTFELATDSAPYFSYKMRLIGGLGLFSCELNAITHENELTMQRETTSRTRYQDLWEKKGIVTHRAKMQPSTDASSSL